MGGAFISVADDATAASWNPGGLVQLTDPEVSFVGSWFHRTEEYEFGVIPEASGEQSVDLEYVNYFSFAWPFNVLKRNMTVSLNYQHLYDFAREWDFEVHQRSDLYANDFQNRFRQAGCLSAVGIAYCIQITPTFSFGITFNIWNNLFGQNEWEKTHQVSQTGVHLPSGESVAGEYSQRDRYTFQGFNANIGAMWNVTDRATIGLVFKSPFSADLDHELTYRSSGPDYFFRSSEDETLHLPMSYGVGFSYRFSDNLTASADVYRTEWRQFLLEDANGNKTSMVSGLPEEDSDIESAIQARFGVEYLHIAEKYIWPVRGGVFYDPAPAEGSPDDYYGFSVGSGLSVRPYVFDAAYQYRFGRNVGGSGLSHLGLSQDTNEHTVYASVIWHF